jgi:hypothetical protein
MTRPQDRPSLEGARAEILAVAAEFRREVGPIVETSLRRRIGWLLEGRREWSDTLPTSARRAFDRALDRAIAAGVGELERRLADEDVWLQPFTAPGVVHRPETGWDGTLPEWVSGFLRRFTRRQDRPVLGALDDPANRVWVAVLSAAKPLDPVLQEFGLAPSEVPNLGGGHYGLRAPTAAQLDPSGVLARLWRRYRAVHERYLALSADLV